MRNHLMEMAGVLACVIGVFAMSSCATAPPTVQGKTDIRDEAATTLSLAQRSDPSLTGVLDGAAGYAVFPSIRKGGAILGGA